MVEKTKLVTKLVRVNGLNPKEFLRDPTKRYVGRFLKLRSGRFKDAEWPNSGFGNKFRFDEEDSNHEKRDKLYCYCATLATNLTAVPSLRKSFFELYGKTLGCWCFDWDNNSPGVPLCHGAYLARLVDMLQETQGSRLGVNILPDGSFREIERADCSGGIFVQVKKFQVISDVHERPTDAAFQSGF